MIPPPSNPEACTIDDVLSWNPCDPPYNLERVTELFAGRETLAALDILDLDIPPEDRLWAILREELIPAPTLHELACRFAEAVLPIYERMHPGDNRPRAAITAKRAWLRGEITDEQLQAARAAAWAAAWAMEAKPDLDLAAFLGPILLPDYEEEP